MFANVTLTGNAFFRSSGPTNTYAYANTTHVKFCDTNQGAGLYGGGECYEAIAYDHAYGVYNENHEVL